MAGKKAHERAQSGEAWQDYCQTLLTAGAMIDSFDDEVTELDRAEWYRFLSRLMRNGAERFMENCEPLRPRLRETPWRQSINFQSPDQDHLLAEFIDGSQDYIINGQRGDIRYFVLASWSAPMPVDAGAQNWAAQGEAGLEKFNPAGLRTTGFLKSDNIRMDEEGRFEIIVSRNDPGEGHNWLPIEDDCVGLLVRNVYDQTYDQRGGVTPPQFDIRLKNQPAPEPLSLGDVSSNLARAGQTVLAYAALVRHWWQQTLSQTPNTIIFSREVYLSTGGVPDRHHGFGRWACAPDEALVIDFTPGACSHWIFQLCNMWQENLDNYEEGDGYIQQDSAVYDAEGGVRMVVAHRNPQVTENFVGCYGHQHGGMSLRLINPELLPPSVTVYRVKLAELERQGLDCLQQVTPLVSGTLSD